MQNAKKTVYINCLPSYIFIYRVYILQLHLFVQPKQHRVKYVHYVVGMCVKLNLRQYATKENFDAHRVYCMLIAMKRIKLCARRMSMWRLAGSFLRHCKAHELQVKALLPFFACNC